MGGASSSESSPSVLIIDDDVMAVEELSEMLEFEGIGCISADSHDHALSLLNAFSSVRVIVTDFYLKGDSIGADNGLSLIEKIRDTFKGRHFETIVVSGDKDVMVDCSFIGVDKFLAKPIAPESLSSIVKGAMGAEPKSPDTGIVDSSKLTLLNMLEAQTATIAELTQTLNETRTNCRKVRGGLDRLVRAASIAVDRLNQERRNDIGDLLGYIRGSGNELKELLGKCTKTPEPMKANSTSEIHA